MAANEYYDKLMLPMTKDMDGGDSCAEAGTLCALDNRSINLFMYFPDSGPVRHPDATKWYGRPGRFSRDQLIPVLCAFCRQNNVWNRVGLIDKVFKFHRARWFVRAWNTIRNFVYEDEQEHYQKSTPDVKWDMSPKPWPRCDITGPEIWGLWIRAYGNMWLYPLLWIFDLETLGGSITWLWRKDRVTRNHLLVVLTTTSHMPTLWSWLARLIMPTADMIDRWGEHCRATGAIDTSELFRREYER